MPQIAAYSKNAPFKGGVGYVLYEYKLAGKARFIKVPMCPFMRVTLK